MATPQPHELLTREQLLRGYGVQVYFRHLRLRRTPQLLPLQRGDAQEVELGLLAVSAGAHRGLLWTAGGEFAAGGGGTSPIACRETGSARAAVIRAWQPASRDAEMQHGSIGMHLSALRGLLPVFSMLPLRYTFRHGPTAPSDLATPSTHMQAGAGTTQAASVWPRMPRRLTCEPV